MRFPLLAAIVAGAALTQVGASPIRVVFLSSTSTNTDLRTAQHLRFGHALADSPVAKMHQPPPLITVAPQPGRRPCGKHFKEKAIQISNAFRHALGFPLIETHHPAHDVPLPFIGTPAPTFDKNHVQDQPNLNGLKAYHKIKHHHHQHHFRQWGNTFTMRIHNALMALGPWEGRAVAFVLGCGIGVLLRMVWVLTVVAYRTIRGEREDEYTQVAIIHEYVDAEDIVVPPPTYTISDEKEELKVKDSAEN